MAITFRQLQRMTVKEVLGQLPLTVTSNGEVVFEVVESVRTSLDSQHKPSGVPTGLTVKRSLVTVKSVKNPDVVTTRSSTFQKAPELGSYHPLSKERQVK